MQSIFGQDVGLSFSSGASIIYQPDATTTQRKSKETTSSLYNQNGSGYLVRMLKTFICTIILE